MNRLICLMGKSCSGKDTIYKNLLKDRELNLKVLRPYTTRPRRINEKEGIEYNFVTEEEYLAMRDRGLILEERAYDTMHGVWRYFTVRDAGLTDNENDLLYIGTLEAYVNLREALGNDKVIPIYIEVSDTVRIDRAVHREKKQAEPRFAEMCRRFLADNEDFSDEKLKEAGVTVRFNNEDLNECLNRIKTFIAAEG
ncbi:MAG: guanylate kinase [Lachnospiraceae bacterium]|nr:guanylate kinase [Lachnospiraceae bacterium]